jgi:hypothetical protein
MSIACLASEQEERQGVTRQGPGLAEFDWAIHAGRHLELFSRVTRSSLLPVALLSTAIAAGAATLRADRGLFASDELVALTLSAPLNELFQHARSEDGYSVGGTLGYRDGARDVTIDAFRSAFAATPASAKASAPSKLKVDFEKHGTPARSTGAVRRPQRDQDRDALRNRPTRP